VPLVSASLGTVFNRTPGVFELICAALRGEPAELALGLGPGFDRARLGELPPHIHAEEYIPQTILFPHCDLLITHGGLNSVVAALCHGLPMVILPIGADQLVNAERCAALGVARVVGPSERGVPAIRAAVRAVLRDGRYRENARRAQREAAALPGLEHGVRLLEQLVAERRPLPAHPAGRAGRWGWLGGRHRID
jgi:MGT family glycosyltransferase